MSRGGGRTAWEELSPNVPSTAGSNTNSGGVAASRPTAHGSASVKTDSSSNSNSRSGGPAPSGQTLGSASADNSGGAAKRKQKRPSKKTRMLSKRVVEMLDLIDDPTQRRSCMEQLSADDPYIRLLCGSRMSSAPASAAAAAATDGTSSSSSAAAAPSCKSEQEDKDIIGI